MLRSSTLAQSQGSGPFNPVKKWLNAALSLVPNILTTLAIAGLILGSTPGLAYALEANALPQGGNVAAGSASIDYKSSSSLVVTQQSDRAVVDWKSFNIGTQASTEFKQPNSGSLAVNRVTGGSGDPTQILGTLKSNGQIMVLDPNGVLFGRNARIDVGGILASTGSINVSQVMSGASTIDIGNMTRGSVVNDGQITAREGGLVALVAPHVVNNGIITARLGRVELASGQAVTVDLYGDRLVELAVSGALANALVENTGTISADGGRVALTARAAQGVVNNVINTTGLISANTVEHKNGRIVLKGNDTGIVHVAGRVQAMGSDGEEKGGRIDITGKQVFLDHATIDVSGRRGGGEAYIGGGIRGSLDGVSNPSAVTDVSAGTVIHADALKKGNGGTVVVWGSEHTGYYGTITARGGSDGGDGGFVEVSTGKGVIFDGTVDTTAAKGKVGTLLIDPSVVSIGNGAANADGSYLNVKNIADNLVFTSVIIQATNNIGIVENVDFSKSMYGTPGYSLTLMTPTFNLDANMNMSVYGLLNLTVDTVNLVGKITSGMGMIDPSRVRSTATQMNVLANTASIQQAMDISSKTASVTVQVSAGQYNENLVINKSLALKGNAGTSAMGADAAAPVIFGTRAGGNVITVNANGVTIEGLHLNALVAGGALADSVNGVAAGNVSGLTIDHNTFEGFVGSGLSVPSGTILNANQNILSPAQQAAADALAAQQAADALAAQQAADALAAQQAADALAAQQAADALAAQQAADALAAQQAADAAAQQAADALAAQQAADALAAQQAADALAAQQAADALAAQQAAADALAAQQAADAAAALAAQQASSLNAAKTYLPTQASAQAIAKVAEHILQGLPLPRGGISSRSGKLEAVKVEPQSKSGSEEHKKAARRN